MNKNKWLEQIEFCKKKLEIIVTHQNYEYMKLTTEKLDEGENCSEEEIPTNVTKYYEAKLCTGNITYYVNPLMDYVEVYSAKGKQKTLKISKLRFDEELKEILLSDN